MFGQKIKRFSITAVLVIMFLSLSGFSAETKRVYDYDDLYSDEDEEELEELLYETSKI